MKRFFKMTQRISLNLAAVCLTVALLFAAASAQTI